jgi:cytochrome c peroxidase
MRPYALPVFITGVVIVFILALPLFSPQRSFKTFSNDEALRKAALDRGMTPVPKEYDALLKLMETPQNPLSREKIALGRALFFDPRLSRDMSISCASCHDLNAGGDDNLPAAIGYLGQQNPFHLNSPTVLNAALAKREFWDGRARDVEEQAGGPIQAPFEMDMTPAELEKRLAEDAYYVSAFKSVFGGSIRFDDIRKAIGAYERTLLTRGSYDAFLEGNNSAISPAAKRGLGLFISSGCKGCHTGMSVGGQSIQKFPLRHYLSDYIGLLFTDTIEIKKSPYPFPDIGGFRGKGGTLRFRVPILRNVTMTAPYFHNGSVKELKEAVRIMSKYQIGQEFTPEQIEDIVAFLKTLEGKTVKDRHPTGS